MTDPSQPPSGADATLTPGDLDLTGRTAVITGAAQGIGAAVARTYAAFGANLVLIDRQEGPLDALAQELNAGGTDVLSETLDVRDPEAVGAAMQLAADRYSQLHVLVNNAGGTFHAPFVDATPKGDETLVRENLLSAAWCIRAAAPSLAPGASIVNVTSIEARRAAPGFALYAAAKAGLEELTRTLALELGERGIRVNAIAPDVVVTPGVGDLAGATTPLGRTGRPEEVAGVALFLATPLSSFVTGTVIAVDGGNLAAAGWFRRDGDWVTPPPDQAGR